MRGMLIVTLCCSLLGGCVMNVKEYQQPKIPIPATFPTTAAMQSAKGGKISLPPLYTSRPTDEGGRVRHILWPFITIAHDPKTSENGVDVVAVMPFFQKASKRFPNKTEFKSFWLFPFFIVKAFQPREGVGKIEGKMQGIFPLYVRNSQQQGKVVSHTVLLFQYGHNPKFHWLQLIPFPEWKINRQ